VARNDISIENAASSINDVAGLNGPSNDSNIASISVEFPGKLEAIHKAIDGDFVHSKAQILIDNWLYMAEIVHAHEHK